MTAACCDYCGLPLSRPPATASEPRYCCYGCRFAADVTRSHGDGAAHGTLLRLALAVFLSLNTMVFTMVLWTGDVYAADRTVDPLSASFDELARWFCLLASLPVLYLLGGPLAASAWQGLRQRQPTTDVLLVIGVVASYAYSIVGVLTAGPVYFEVGCVVLVMVTLGRWLEATGRSRASAALEALARLLPATACRVEGAGEATVAIEELNQGDVVRVRPGERLPADGRLERGRAAIDEQLFTGEPTPAVKEAGDNVCGGTLNLDGDLLVRLTAGPRSGTLQRLVAAVEAARLERGHYQRLADRVASRFLPLVAVLALGTFLGYGYFDSWQVGTMRGLAVVLIACPCALALATPLAVWTALGAAAQAQAICAGGSALERLARARVVAFDKTGTLTTGVPTLAETTFDPTTDRPQLLDYAAALASASRHPVSQTIASYCHERMSPGPAAMATAALTTALPGRGLRAEFGRQTVWLGSQRLLDEQDLAWSPELLAARQRADEAGWSTAGIGWEGRVRGLFACRESLRPTARAAIVACQALGLHTIVLTGDNVHRARMLAEELAIPVRAELLPEGKWQTLRALRQQFGSTVMVGDGVNDAPALAAADVGIALGCGADVSRASAEVCLLSDDLRRVAWSIDWARRTVRVIRQNLFWSFVYNTLGIGLAMTGWLTPVWAAVAMVLSSLLVVGNSLRLAHDPRPLASLAAPCIATSDGHRTLDNSTADVSLEAIA